MGEGFKHLTQNPGYRAERSISFKNKKILHFIQNVKNDNKKYNSVAVLKLSVENHFSENNLSNSQKEVFSTLQKEAKVNRFELRIL